MPRMPLHLASGGAIVKPAAPKSIRFVRYGCTNRPFFHIVVMHRCWKQRAMPIEQLGTYDPCENQYNEKLVTFNFERLQYWLGQGTVSISKPVEQLLGLAGYLPIHPSCYLQAWRKRRANDEATAKAAESKEEPGDVSATGN